MTFDRFQKFARACELNVHIVHKGKIHRYISFDSGYAWTGKTDHSVANEAWRTRQHTYWD